MPLAKPLSMLIIAATLICGASSSAAAKDEWIFEQKAPELGDQTLYVTNDGFRVVNRMHDFEIVSKAPDWKAVWINPSRKGMYIQKKLDLQQVLGLAPQKSNMAVLQGHTKLQGLNCKAYIEGNSCITLGAEDVPLAPQGAKALCSYWSIPLISEVPVKNYWPVVNPNTYKKGNYLDFSQYGHVHTAAPYKFTTVSWKKVPFKSSDFAIPTGLKPISDPKQVIISANDMSQMTDMIDTLMFTNDPKKPAKGKNEK